MFRTAQHYAAALLLFMIVTLIAACGVSTPAEPTAPTAPAAEEPTEAGEEPTEPVEEPTEPVEEPTEEVTTGEIDYAALSGAINIDGSSTVEPLTLAIAEEFRAVAPDVNVTVGRSGTGGGFEKFCNGETDINDASRAINAEETATCADNGIEPVELFVGLDGLAVVVNPANDFVESLTYAQLQQIFQDGGASTWADVDPEWPAEPIAIYAPDPDSGTYDFFVEEIGLRGEEEDEPAFTGNYTASADDNTLVQGVEGDEFAIAFFGYAFYEQEQDRMTVLGIAEEDGDDPIIPNAETVEDGSYPLARPLFIYPAASALQEKPQVAGFVQFYLENVTDVIGDVGYFPGSAEREAESMQALAEALGQ